MDSRIRRVRKEVCVTVCVILFWIDRSVSNAQPKLSQSPPDGRAAGFQNIDNLEGRARKDTVTG